MAQEAAGEETEITPAMIWAGVSAFYAYADDLVVGVPESALASLAAEVFAAMQVARPGN